MTVSLNTQKILWGKAAARCAMPKCRRQLVEDISETDDPTLVGENCHIFAEKDGSPRSDPTMSVDARNRYANLVLLCNVDHKIIDDNEAVWTVDRLKALKAEHEAWVEQSRARSGQDIGHPSGHIAVGDIGLKGVGSAAELSDNLVPVQGVNRLVAVAVEHDRGNGAFWNHRAAGGGLPPRHFVLESLDNFPDSGQQPG